MSKNNNFIKKLLEELSVAFPTIAIIGGLVGGFLLWAFAPEDGIWGIEKDTLAIAPIVLPVLIFLAGGLLKFAVDFVLIIFQPQKQTQNKGIQLLMIAILLACAVGVYFVNANAWQNDYWQEATKYGNNGGIGDVVADMFEFATDYWQVVLTAFAIEVAISVAMLVSLNIGRKKYIEQFADIICRLVPFALIGAVVMLVIICAIYTPVTTLIFAYLFALTLVLLPSYFSITKNTCTCCYYYKCGKTLVSTTTETYVDHDDMKVVDSTDFHFDDDDTTYTVQTVSPTVKSKTTKTYKCNRCGMEFDDSAIKIIK